MKISKHEKMERLLFSFLVRGFLKNEGKDITYIHARNEELQETIQNFHTYKKRKITYIDCIRPPEILAPLNDVSLSFRMLQLC